MLTASEARLIVTSACDLETQALDFLDARVNEDTWKEASRRTPNGSAVTLRIHNPPSHILPNILTLLKGAGYTTHVSDIRNVREPESVLFIRLD